MFGRTKGEGLFHTANAECTERAGSKRYLWQGETETVALRRLKPGAGLGQQGSF